MVRWDDGEHTTAQQLWHSVCQVGAGLAAVGIDTGDRLLFVLPEVQKAVTSLFAAWKIGAVPIQVGLPAKLQSLDDYASYLAALVQRLHIRALIVPQEFVETAVGSVDDTMIVAVESLFGECPIDENIVSADAPALIQLTSGTTALPRGVVVSQEHLAAHLEAIAKVLPAGADASGVTWLPLYHDMGLIGGLLYPIWTDFPVTLLAPQDFRASPYRWLTEIAKTNATHTAGPPSAYALVSRFAGRARRDELRLDSLRCAMVGAETIAPRVLRQFSEAFRSCGFREEAFFPVYGLAEATVAVTFPTLLEPTKFDLIEAEELTLNGRATPQTGGNFEVTGVGKPIPGTRIRLVDATGQEVPERTVGEILVQTQTGMAGYYGEPPAATPNLHDDWLPTGDLGYLVDGELFVTGRKKDLIIAAGRNLSPLAIEDLASQVSGVRPGSVVAIGVRSEQRSTERAVLFVETNLREDKQASLQQQILDTLANWCLDVDEIRFVQSGSLPRTSSGKIIRHAVAKLQGGTE